MKVKNVHNICIDGSYNFKDKMAGIGVYDDLTNKSIYFKITNLSSSFEAEEEALKYALLYVGKHLKFESFRIFTDNEQLFNFYKDKLEKIENCLNMIWIPREFNQKADELSKLGRLTNEENLIKEKIKVKIKKKINFKITDNCLEKKEKTNINITIENKIITPLKNNEIALFIRNNYSYEAKKSLIIKLCNRENIFEKNLIDMIFNDKKIVLKPIKDNVLLNFISAILHKRERGKSLNTLICNYKLTTTPKSKEIEKLLKRIK